MGVLARLDGVAVFGGAVQVKGPNLGERRAQVNAYPGLNGTEELDLGDAPVMTTVTGRIAGNSPSALAAIMNDLRSFWDGQTHVLTDNLGVDWPDVKVVGVEFSDDFKFDADIGYTTRYTMQFKHLSLP